MRMSDGRLFTDYRPRCDIALQFSAPMTGSYEYRQWMMNNGQRIIDHQRAIAFNNARCGPCSKPSTMPNDKDRFVCDKVACTRVKTPAASTAERMRAFGTGRDYTAPPLKA
jgi:ribosomal protein S27AE